MVPFGCEGLVLPYLMVNYQSGQQDHMFFKRCFHRGTGVLFVSIVLARDFHVHYSFVFQERATQILAMTLSIAVLGLGKGYDKTYCLPPKINMDSQNDGLERVTLCTYGQLRYL